ncbi:MAG: hypothetical protein HZB39_01455 [Planctomycetes bacterium]|nr:hypothetical protein [Planctomycetota bacterium]
MAHRATGRRAEGADLFPWVVCLVSLAVGLVIWFRSTTPSLAEQRELEAVERGIRADLRASDTETRDLRARRTRLESDPETVLVELDRAGIDPSTLPATREDPVTTPASAGRASRR